MILMLHCTNGKPDGQHLEGKPQTQKKTKRRPPMHQVFIEGGLIRKLWSVETDAYRDHLLRLDAESRRNRFCGAIADEHNSNLCRNDARQRCDRSRLLRGRSAARRRRSAHSGRSTGARPRPPSASRSGGRATVSARRCSNAACSPRATAASSSCTYAASRKTSACSNSPANSRPSSPSISAR